jgi:hypothetical protein
LKRLPPAAGLSGGDKVWLRPGGQGHLSGWPLTSQQVAEFLRGYIVSDAETTQLGS